MSTAGSQIVETGENLVLGQHFCKTRAHGELASAAGSQMSAAGSQMSYAGSQNVFQKREKTLCWGNISTKLVLTARPGCFLTCPNDSKTLRERGVSGDLSSMGAHG